MFEARIVVSMDFHWKFRDGLCLRHGWLFLSISIRSSVMHYV